MKEQDYHSPWFGNSNVSTNILYSLEFSLRLIGMLPSKNGKQCLFNMFLMHNLNLFLLCKILSMWGSCFLKLAMLIVIGAIFTMIIKLWMILVAFIFISMACLEQHIDKSTQRPTIVFPNNSNLHCLCRLNMCCNGQGSFCQL